MEIRNSHMVVVENGTDKLAKGVLMDSLGSAMILAEKYARENVGKRVLVFGLASALKAEIPITATDFSLSK